MPNSLPVKNLIKINWLISLTCAALVFVFMVALGKDFNVALPRMIEVLLMVMAISFCDLFMQKSFGGPHTTSNKYAKLKFYLTSYLVACIIGVIVRYFYSWTMQERWEGEKSPLLSSLLAFMSLFIVNSFVLTIQSLIILQHIRTKSELENLQLKANENEINNLLLRQQIHPHFLFNSLNTIKSLYRTDATVGQKYLVHLANFLRVSLSNQNTTTTLVRNEIAFCLDYLKMQSIRFDKAFSYSIDISNETMNNKYIPYFSLQPLIENVLKHNDLTEEAPIAIMINEIQDYIYISNNVQPKSFKEISTGIGLSSLTERYRLLGAGKVIVNSGNGKFEVGIQILTS